MKQPCQPNLKHFISMMWLWLWWFDKKAWHDTRHDLTKRQTWNNYFDQTEQKVFSNSLNSIIYSNTVPSLNLLIFHLWFGIIIFPFLHFFQSPRASSQERLFNSYMVNFLKLVWEVERAQKAKSKSFIWAWAMGVRSNNNTVHIMWRWEEDKVEKIWLCCKNALIEWEDCNKCS